MKNLKIKLPAQDEKGIALLFTLGILAVLLVIALGFATTSITERRAAGNNNDLTAARMLAESAVNRAVGAMRFHADSGDQFDDIISHDESSTPTQNQQTFDMLYKLNTVVNGSLIWPSWSWSGYDKTKSSEVHWQYVNNGLDTTDAKYKLIGRYAYVVFGTSGKLDPAACVNQTVAASADESAKGPLPDEYDGDVEDRKGISVSEISIYNLDQNTSTFLPLPTVTKFSYNPLILAGTLTSERWADWETMFTALGIGTAATAQREKYREWFILNNPKDPEAFWVDLNGDGIEEPSELYHRFNLARTDWDTLDDAPNGNDDSNPINEILRNPTAYSVTTTHDGAGIKWLKNYTNNLPAETFKDAAGTAMPDYRANQIAANLIDYCDTYSNPTRDSEADPTYTGNELTPYINEIAVRVDASATVASAWPFGVGRKFTYNITYYLGAEVVNVYGASLDLNKNTTLTILEGTISYKYTTPDSDDTTFTAGTPISLNNKVVTLSTITTDPLNSDYTFKWDTGTINPAVSITELAFNSNAKIVSINVQIKRAKLNYDGNFADFAKPDYAGGVSEIAADPPASALTSQPGIGGPSATGTCFFSYQVDDPRQNLNDEDWATAKQQLSGTYGSTGTDYGTQGAINSSTIVKCTSLGDAEPSSTPTTISTNYIRNAPMQSPWELGFIHRGAAWETINLKTYNYDDNNDGTIDTNENGTGKDLGIGAYSKGDANILDQVKMTSETQVYGKINVQAAKANTTTGEFDVLKALLGYIRFGVPMNSTNSNPGNRGFGTVLAYASTITNIVGIAPGSILNARNTAPFKTRAQIVRAVKLSDGSEFTQTTDAAKEEIIGKFINLTKAQAADTYTIIAIAQTIKDVGTPLSGAGITISKDLNQDGIINPANPNMKGDVIAESTVGFRDAGGTRTATADSIPDFYETLTDTLACKLGQYDLGADEILAEQKIMATVYRDTLTGRWRILRYEYLDE